MRVLTRLKVYGGAEMDGIGKLTPLSAALAAELAFFPAAEGFLAPVCAGLY